MEGKVLGITIKGKNQEKVEIAVSGRLDTTTAPELESVILGYIRDGITELALDIEELEYISSAGLRVMLISQKEIRDKGKMYLENVRPEVYEVFEITGFTDIMTII